MFKDLVKAFNTPSKAGQGRMSRLEQDYEHVREIGEGHFGSVLQCVHRLDGLDYAVKISKKPTKKHNCLEEALHEVFALSALSVAGENPYIVRYYTGWIENNQLVDDTLVYRSYAAALLMVHYQVHAKERLKGVAAYLDKVHAHRDPRKPAPQLEIDSAATIQSRLATFWRPRGLPIHFEAPDD